MSKIALVTDKKIAETSSKGNQEKWFDKESNLWYKLDAFGYEALSEQVVSRMLEYSNIERETPFRFVRYSIDRVIVHGRERTVSVSENFLGEDESIITIASLLTRSLGEPVTKRLGMFNSDKKRIEFLGNKTAEITGLDRFGEYLTLLFEIDSLFLNDDRHLNNIAVIKKDGGYDYCPIFDNGAALLSNVGMSPMDIEPKALIGSLVARPFMTTFTRQMKSAEAVWGRVLEIPRFSRSEIAEIVRPALEFYPERDRALILNRIVTCIIARQKALD